MRAAARRSHDSTPTSLYQAAASGVLENAAASGRPRMIFGFAEACDETGLGVAPCGRGALAVGGRLALGGATPAPLSTCAAQCSAGSTCSIFATEAKGEGQRTLEFLSIDARMR